MDLFTGWAAQEGRWPLLFLLSVPPAFYIIQKFLGLSFRDTLFHWAFFLSVGLISLTSSLLFFFIVSEVQYGRLFISIPLMLLGVATTTDALLRIKPPSLPPDRLVVALVPFSPIGEDATPDAESFPHRIESHLREKGEEGAPLLLKRLSKPIAGSSENDRKKAALALGRSREGHAHIVVWGDVRRDEGELFIHPRISFANPLGAEHLAQ